MIRNYRNLARLVSGAALLLAIAVIGVGAPSAPARAEGPLPSFSAPLEISNTYFPFRPGSMKVFSGYHDGAPEVVVESHGRATREFIWNGGTVACRVIERVEFRGGIPRTREQHFVAQSDDGVVWSFGEVEDRDVVDDGDEGEPDGWIVGSRAVDDPATVVENSPPAIVMPAFPSVGDAWIEEDAAPAFSTGARVLGFMRLSVAVGRFPNTLRVRNTDFTDGSSSLEWYAPGVGLVRARARGERLSLRASTYRAVR